MAYVITTDITKGNSANIVSKRNILLLSVQNDVHGPHRKNGFRAHRVILPAVIINCMCQLDWALGCPDKTLLLAMSVRVLLHNINV